jgi:hypothetical protein
MHIKLSIGYINECVVRKAEERGELMSVARKDGRDC